MRRYLRNVKRGNFKYNTKKTDECVRGIWTYDKQRRPSQSDGLFFRSVKDVESSKVNWTRKRLSNFFIIYPS